VKLLKKEIIMLRYVKALPASSLKPQSISLKEAVLTGGEELEGDGERSESAAVSPLADDGTSGPPQAEYRGGLPAAGTPGDEQFLNRLEDLVVRLSGARLHAITEEQCVCHILDALDASRGGWVVTMNLDLLRKFVQQPDCKDLYSKANLFVADGMPLVWACRLQGTPLPQRVAGSNLIWSLSAQAAFRGKSIFLLGGNPGTAEAAALELQGRYPELKIAGTFCPEMGFEKNEGEWERLVAAVVCAKPDIVYVALGSPKQELLIEQLRDKLPQAWWLGVGISFSFVSGDVQRAPVWVQQAGLEWLHRLVQDPGRLGKRYLVQGIPFAIELLASAAVRRFFSSSSTERVTRPSPQI
jgi:N-acetylglucosaminyldiphosphoundecaprenol N-acetyl-beta-D-mannosaminyltransferase